MTYQTHLGDVQHLVPGRVGGQDVHVEVPCVRGVQLLVVNSFENRKRKHHVLA